MSQSVSETDQVKGEPQRIPLSSGNPALPYLPGTSLKGALRAQAERICRTLSSAEDGGSAVAVAALFGTTATAGALGVTDFKGAPAEPVIHEMVAIDRFTGGAADGRKFAVRAFEEPTLKGALTVDLARTYDTELTGKAVSSAAKLNDAALGLLALVLRDLAEGDIVFGYGKRKGYGAIRRATFDGGPLVSTLKGKLKSRCLRECVNEFRETFRTNRASPHDLSPPESAS